jgi:arginine deiminase
MELSLKNIFFMISVGVILISVLLSILQSKTKKYTVLFRQPSESTPAKHILVHIPEKEIFMSTLHPAASLYEDVTDERKVKECFDNLEKILKEKNIELITVRSALKINRTALKELAFEALKYELEDNINIDKNSTNYETLIKYSNDSYKNEIIGKLSDDQLVDVVLNNPTYKLGPTKLNTFIEPTQISFNPLGNLIFCRDQQITTSKGVVIGRARSSQRAGEHKVMKQVFKNLNSNLLGIVTEKYDKDAYLEGGDYFVAKKDLSMLGVGLRTSMKGAEYLMENDFLGTRYLAVVYDNEDLDQQRMHLDTYFNFLNDKYVIVLDFDEVQTHYPDKKIGRKVYLYDNKAEKGINSDDKNVPNSSGKYKLVKIYEKFYTFLEENNYELIKVNHQQQIDYMINFLNIGDNTVLSVNKDLQEVAKKSGVKSIFLEFRPILNMFGAMHCITQVSRVD